MASEPKFFDFEILEDLWFQELSPLHREHLALNFYDYRTQRPVHPERYKVGTVACPEEFRRPDLILDVNTLEEYSFMKELYEYLYPRNPQFHITDIIRWYDEIYMKGRKSERKT